MIIRDEREAQNFVYDETLVAGDVVATVRLPCRTNGRSVDRDRGSPPSSPGPALLALAVCLVAVAVLVAVRPDPATDFRRSYADVAVNEQGRLRVFDVTVTSARRVVSVPRTEAPFTSDQALVVVGMEGAVRLAPSYFTSITLISEDGHSTSRGRSSPVPHRA